MPHSLTSRRASNWVDRGESPLPVLERSVRYFLGRHDERDQPWIGECAAVVLGMVSADATDVHIVGYLKVVAREHSIPWPLNPRQAAIALWHIAKAALVRDIAARVLNSDLVNEPAAPESLSRWLAGKLLTPAELAQYLALGEAGEGESPYAPSQRA
jgi:hypothetical protein